MSKPPANQPCPCGSGKKYKLCHGRGASWQLGAVTPPAFTPSASGSNAAVSKVTGLREVPVAILPGEGVDSLFELMCGMDPNFAEHAPRIRDEKVAGTRAKPSASAELGPSTLDDETRVWLLDEVARLVDENQSGRSDMCVPFAALLGRALAALGIDTSVLVGDVTYHGVGGASHTWHHAWVIAGDELVDGNIDSARENPMVAEFMQNTPPKPYWGPISTVPADRSFPEASSPYTGGDGNDHDIELWWVDLRASMVQRRLLES